MSVSTTSRRGRALLTLVLVAAPLAWVGLASPADAVLPATPTLSLARTIATSPFSGSSVATRDNEGSAYVPRDGSFWIADDDADSLHEVDVSTGALKRTISGSAFAAVRQLGGGSAAGSGRVQDFESVAYDEATDTLYAFSGSCCSASVLPAVFRLTRSGGQLQPDSFQPLPASDFTAAAWNPADGKVYVGISGQLRTYDYPTNTAGATFGISGVSGILGMDFTADGKDLFIARAGTTISRVSWASRQVVPGWSFDVSSFGMLDTRAVEVVADQLWISDGYDARGAGDPLAHAVFVIDVGANPAPTPPTPPVPGTPAAPVNLVGNPGFERSLAGWGGSRKPGIRLTRVRGGHEGHWSARVRRTKGHRTLAFRDAPGWVPTSEPGTYRARVWVRANRPGGNVRLRLRELRGDNPVGRTVVRVSLTRRWQRVGTALETRASGRSSIELSAKVRGPRARMAIKVDQVELTRS